MTFDRFARLAAGWIALAACVAPVLRAQGEISPNVRLQMAELLADKEARTPAQRKLASHLIYGARMRRGQSITPHLASMPAAMNTLKMRGELVEVDLDGDITDDLTKAVQSAGGQIESSFPEYHTLRAWLPLLQCERLAERADVHFIVPAAVAHTASHPVAFPAAKPAPKSAKPRGRPAGMLFSPLTPQGPAVPDTGGIIAHGANFVQAMGYIGTGVKVGVMSDGTDSLSTLQQQGYLPNNITVVPGQAGTGDEGTALMNVIYDMAPGVQMFYATAHSSAAAMAANINTLVNVYHVDILVDDVNWSSEGMFQDTAIAQAITNAANAGVLCFTAAANNNNYDSFTGGTWLGDYAPATGNSINISGSIYTLHDFGGGNAQNPVSGQPGNGSAGFWFILQWSDPWGCPTDNYDLFLISAGNIVGASTNQQTGCFGLPPEQYINPGQLGVSVAIAKSPTAAVRALQLNTGRAELGLYSDGAVVGHSGSASEVSVAAAEVGYTVNPPVANGGAIFTGGSANPIDILSSDGPRLIFFDVNGNLLNPGAANPYTIGGGGATTLNKVDITAADGVNTAVPLYDPFGGTSAAAPHAAAIGALIKSADPYITNANVVAAMKSTALVVTTNFIQTGGVFPRTQGAGIAMANRAVAAVMPQVTFASTPSGQSITIAGSGCNPGTYSTPITKTFLTDAVCTVTLNTPTIPGGAGSQQVFTSWSDLDTSNPKTITIGLGGPFTYTANYEQQYLLTTGVFPPASGGVASLPVSSNGYYPSGLVVQVAATPATGYSFTQWTNDAGGNANPNFVTMSAPRNVIANFANPTTSAVGLTMMSESALAGQNVQIPIQVAASGTAVPSNFQFTLNFDPTKLTFSSAQASTALTGAGKILVTQSLGAGTMKFTSTGANQTPLPAGAVGYAIMTLNPQFTSNGTLVSMQSCSATNAQASGLTTNCGTAIVEAGWCDVTGNGTITAADVAQMLAEALGQAPPANNLTQAGVVNVGAIQLVINAIIGLGCPY